MYRSPQSLGGREVFSQMKSQDVRRLRDQLNQLSKRANEQLGLFDTASIGIGRYVPGSSPWERHANGDELLLITDGEVQVEVLEVDGGSFVELLTEGSLFVVPKGHWHKLTATAHVNIVYVSPSEDGVERQREHPLGKRGA
jgi:mannose-6-phosphate isomerase-like protein (cupin superfamily)